jgi:hypothetical protein
MKTSAIALLIYGSLLWLTPLALAANDNWRKLGPKEKDKIIRNYERWEKLPPQDKEHLREEWDRWQRMPQDRRDHIKQRFKDQRGNRRED